jgi:hypothetical protein
MNQFNVPVFLLVLDGVGSVLAVLGLLGWLQVDIGLPVLTRIWPLLLALGLALMVPMIAWVIRLARSRS